MQPDRTMSMDHTDQTGSDSSTKCPHAVHDNVIRVWPLFVQNQSPFRAQSKYALEIVFREGDVDTEVVNSWLVVGEQSCPDHAREHLE